jgi:hypothetical protein
MLWAAIYLVGVGFCVCLLYAVSAAQDDPDILDDWMPTAFLWPLTLPVLACLGVGVLAYVALAKWALRSTSR